jgi:hypothetical protein
MNFRNIYCSVGMLLCIYVYRGCQVRSAHARVLFTFLFQTIDNLEKLNYQNKNLALKEQILNGKC